MSLQQKLYRRIFGAATKTETAAAQLQKPVEGDFITQARALFSRSAALDDAYHADRVKVAGNGDSFWMLMAGSMTGLTLTGGLALMMGAAVAGGALVPLAMLATTGAAAFSAWRAISLHDAQAALRADLKNTYVAADRNLGLAIDALAKDLGQQPPAVRAAFDAAAQDREQARLEKRRACDHACDAVIDAESRAAVAGAATVVMGSTASLWRR